MQRIAQILPPCHCKLQNANCKLPSVDRKMLIGLNASYFSPIRNLQFAIRNLLSRVQLKPMRLWLGRHD
jgi:hypothetical protein